MDGREVVGLSMPDSVAVTAPSGSYAEGQCAAPASLRPPLIASERGGASSCADPAQATAVVAGALEEGVRYAKMEDDLDDDPSDRPDHSNKNDGEDCDDSCAVSPSVASTILTADGIHDPCGFAVISLVVLLGDMCRGITFPTLWPLVQSLNGTTVTLGYAVAAFAFGRIVASPVFGNCSVQHGHPVTLLLSVSVLLLSSILYTQIQKVNSAPFLILVQTMLGIGSGTLGVTRAFVADVTATRHRTAYMAWLTAVQYTGFTVTPCVGALFAKIFAEGKEREVNLGIFVLNAYTSPGLFLSTVSILTLVLIKTRLEDRNRSEPVERKQKSLRRRRRNKQEAFAASRICWNFMTSYDACIVGCMLLNVSTKGSIASFETLGVSYASSHFGLDSSHSGSIVAACGSVGVLSLLSMGHIASYASDVQMIVSGLTAMLLGVLSLAEFRDEGDGGTSEANPTWRYMAAMFLIYSVGYPIGHTAVMGLFSKIVGRRPQGTLQGWFASAGSLARMLFPITSGFIARFHDVETLFYILAGILGGSVISALYCSDLLARLST